MNDPGSTPTGPTPAQIVAMIGLLGDDDVPIAAAARERLVQWGELATGPLREGAEAESLRIRSRCRGVP